MSARTTVADMQWLRDQLATLVSDDPTQVGRLDEWIGTAIRVRVAQVTRSKTKQHDELMDAYRAAVEQWKRACEKETAAYPAEVAEFRKAHPMPTLRAFLVASSRPAGDVCPLCGAPLDELADARLGSAAAA